MSAEKKPIPSPSIALAEFKRLSDRVTKLVEELIKTGIQQIELWGMHSLFQSSEVGLFFEASRRSGRWGIFCVGTGHPDNGKEVVQSRMMTKVVFLANSEAFFAYHFKIVNQVVDAMKLALDPPPAPPPGALVKVVSKLEAEHIRIIEALKAASSLPCSRGAVQNFCVDQRTPCGSCMAGRILIANGLAGAPEEDQKA